MPKNSDLGSFVKQLEARIAKVDGSAVKCSFDAAKYTLSLTKLNGSGMPVEEFLVWHPPSAKPVAAYTLHDKTRMRFAEPENYTFMNIRPSLNALTAVRSFVMDLSERKMKLSSLDVLSYHKTIGAEAVPLFITYFAEHMLGK